MPAERRIYAGPSLRRLRRDRGLTQADMAADLDVSASYIALLERNQFYYSMLAALAAYYDFDLDTPFEQLPSKAQDVVLHGSGKTAIPFTYMKGGPLLRQMKALGINAKFMGGDGVCTDALYRLSAGAAADGVVTCAEAGGVTADMQKNMDDFRARYKKKYGQEVQLYAPYVYDAIMTMADAMEQANSSEPAKYLPVLAKIKHQGVTGLVEFDQFGDIKDGALTLFTYKGGIKTKMEVVK